MITYTIAPIPLSTLIKDMRDGSLIPDAYFQRNFVWREVHQQEFIKTILLGYPFPQIFTSRGTVNIKTMEKTSCIVDGQQRMKTILMFVDDELMVDGKKFSDLEESEQEQFANYLVPVIELHIQNNDPDIKEIFQRINKTANALTGIEKISSQYASSDFMFTCRAIAGDLKIKADEDDDDDDLRLDPSITEDMLDWAKSVDFSKVQNTLLNSEIFTKQEISRKVPLQYIMNITSTYLSGSYYNRNEKAYQYIEMYAESFPDKEEVLEKIFFAMGLFEKSGLHKNSIWKKKANFFTVICEFMKIEKAITEDKILEIASKFDYTEESLPADYKSAAQEAVNNKKQRDLRGKFIKGILDEIL